MKIVITHDSLLEYGGAERFLEILLEIFPDAQIVTLFYNVQKFPDYWRNYNIRAMFPYLPFAKRYPQFWAPILVWRMQNEDLSEFDLIFSSDQIFAKMIRVLPGQRHICYQHSPSNMLYAYRKNYERSAKWMKWTTYLQKDFLRLMESFYACQIDVLLANSENTARRVRCFWGREAQVVYSGVKIPKYRSQVEKEDFYLVVCRLVPEKHVDLIISACAQLNVRLKIVGKGECEVKLRGIANEKVEFMGFVENDVRNELYSKARGLIIAAEEDMGLTALEAMACGTAVLAYNKGGVKETIVDGRTGIFFNELNVASLLEGLARFEKAAFERKVCHAQAQKYNINLFSKKILRVVDEAIAGVYV